MNDLYSQGIVTYAKLSAGGDKREVAGCENPFFNSLLDGLLLQVLPQKLYHPARPAQVDRRNRIGQFTAEFAHFAEPEIGALAFEAISEQVHGGNVALVKRFDGFAHFAALFRDKR